MLSLFLIFVQECLPRRLHKHLCGPHHWHLWGQRGPCGGGHRGRCYGGRQTLLLRRHSSTNDIRILIIIRGRGCCLDVGKFDGGRHWFWCAEVVVPFTTKSNSSRTSSSSSSASSTADQPSVLRYITQSKYCVLYILIDNFIHKVFLINLAVQLVEL